MTQQLFDGSRYQGAPNWQQVAASGVVKGTVWNVDDPAYAQRLRDAHAAGLTALGVYKYVTAGADPLAAADDLVAKGRAVGLPLTIYAADFEEGAGDQTQRVESCLVRIESQVGTAATWLYSGGWWIGPHVKATALELARFKLWDAAYTASEPPAPAPWKTISAWQRTSSGSVPGVSGNVDLDEFSDPAPQPAPPTPSAATADQEDDPMRLPFTRPDGIRDIYLALDDGVVHVSITPAYARHREVLPEVPGGGVVALVDCGVNSSTGAPWVDVETADGHVVSSSFTSAGGWCAWVTEA